MKTIVEGNTGILKLLGKQSIKNTTYRLMKYLLKAGCKDGILLHNVITGHMVLLSDEESNLLECLPAAPSQALTKLIEYYFLVPVDYNEKESVQELRRIVKRLRYSKDIQHYTILTTTNCNARCFYCFQEGYPHVNMNRETADQLVDYMIRHHGKKTLSLAWFGGEPLVCVDRIYQICDGLRKNNVGFQSTMISNGYLFTEAIVEDAVKQWNLKRVQITLDGTEEIYNKTKAFVSVNDNPYLRVLKNIGFLLSNKVQVNVRLNLGNHNMEDLQVLIEYLNKIFPDHRYLKAYVQVLFEHDGFSHNGVDTNCLLDMYLQQYKLNSYLEELGLYKHDDYLPCLRYRKCMADTNTAVAVYPDGRLFKCEHTAIGDDFGSINNEFVNKKIISEFTETYEISSCSMCPLYPHCILLKKCIPAPESIRRILCRQDIDHMTRSMIRKYKQSPFNKLS